MEVGVGWKGMSGLWRGESARSCAVGSRYKIYSHSELGFMIDSVILDLWYCIDRDAQVGGNCASDKPLEGKSL